MTLLTKPPAGAQGIPLTPVLGTARPSADPGWFRAFMLRIHFYAGILAGPFLLIAAVTGGLYAMAPTLEQAIYTGNCTSPPLPSPCRSRPR